MAITDKFFPSTASVAAVMVLCGCQTTPTKTPSDDDYVWPSPEKEMSSTDFSETVATIVISNCESFDLGRCSPDFKVAVVGIDGKRIKSGKPFGVPPESYVDAWPGEHIVHVAVRWSNGAISTGRLPLTVERGVTYRVFAYEARDQSELVSAKPVKKPAPAPKPNPDTVLGISRDNLLEGLGFSFMVAMPWVILPLAVADNAYRGYTEERERTLRTAPEGVTGALPFNRCCWLWIEDARGKVVAGTSVVASGAEN